MFKTNHLFLGSQKTKESTRQSSIWTFEHSNLHPTSTEGRPSSTSPLLIRSVYQRVDYVWKMSVDTAPDCRTSFEGADESQ